MQKLKQHTTRFIVMLLALQIMNLSIDARPVEETMLVNSAKDTNRIDNALEYVVEIILDQKNAMPEQKGDQDQNPSHINKAEIFKVFTSTPAYQPYVVEEKIISVTPLIFREGYQYQFCTEINPPPPKAIAC